MKHNTLTDLLYRGSFGIPDEDVDDLLSSIDSKKALQFLRNKQIGKTFINTYEKWLFSSNDHLIQHLDKNKFHLYITLGTTQSFHDFYQIQHNKTLKVARGEYPYHRVFFKSINRKWAWIDEYGVNSNDIFFSY